MPVPPGTDKTLMLPPGFQAVPAERPWETALAMATDHPPGTLLHAPLGGLLDAALILAPDRPVTDDSVRHLATQAVHDALLPAVPPQCAVTTAAGAVSLNHGEVATLRIARGPALADGTPSWLVLGLTIRVAFALEAPGLTPWQTDLAEEGADITAADLLEAICRHLLAAFHEAWEPA